MKKGALSRRSERNPMKDATTGKTSTSKAKSGTDWNKLRRISDAQIHAGIESDPDAHPTDDEFWKDAKVVLPSRKEVVTMRLDADLLEWFRQQRGYQTRINAILRAYMKAHHKEST
jgi:uncharacterized protein (DUF4415 family)